jgi:hypothetical protein
MSRSTYLITPIISGQQYRSQSCSPCSFLQSPVTSSLLPPTQVPPSAFVPSQCERPRCRPVQNSRQNYSFFDYSTQQYLAAGL